MCLRRTAGWNGRHGTLKQVFSPLLLLFLFFFLLQLSSGIRKSFTTWFWHTDVLKKKRRHWWCSEQVDMKTAFSYTNSYNGMMSVCFCFCLQASAWHHFFVCVCVCFTLSFLSKLKFTMYRWTIYCCSLQGQSKTSIHIVVSWLRLRAKIKSSAHYFLLSLLLLHLISTESSLSSSSRLFFYLITSTSSSLTHSKPCCVDLNADRFTAADTLMGWIYGPICLLGTFPLAPLAMS